MRQLFTNNWLKFSTFTIIFESYVLSIERHIIERLEVLYAYRYQKKI